MSQLSESNLIQQVQAGDEAALIELHRRYVNLVYSIAYRVLNDQMAAEEVTQDTFLRVWNKSDSYDPERGAFVTWLATIARRLAIDVFRQQERKPLLGAVSVDESPDIWNAVSRDDQSDLRRTLQAVLNDLPGDQRDVLELAYFYGMTHSDIASYLQVPLGTVKTRIRLGMEKLRIAWKMEPSVNPSADD
jgi:RNA polymerase sigma-70 factor (ECF subfamily)